SSPSPPPLFSTPFNASPTLSGTPSAPSSQIHASLLGPGKAVVSFDTMKMCDSLQEAGFSKAQAQTVLRVLVAGMEECTLRSTAMIATRRDLLDLKSDLSERLFGSTMRFDVAQRHNKEVIERDLQSLRSDVNASIHAEIQKIEREMSNLEKVLTDRHLTRRELMEQRVSVLQVAW
ncbi:hypothetical protein NGA_0165400, partial [Nannochloropsis gaditana CCMP526]|uniref:uncharacterized protein n=1 Tax=Nannochloropsis gaditana (strain CCMP526) TaxID=1093141 RepID=UPI00029F5C8E